ncbi:membrane protein [Sulfuricaulis limicola]|uniref:Membrane protein n=1 Tax=Sulfuricaulis limicola TaxID=1620215 RepID=A0A1B4XIC5_9GAMM|nr:MFS transporter [Sulfuricaulis limicola]BAV34556.1 membrane protein [Sulfuricaulis limicola]
MSPQERRAAAGLASIYGLRMLGMFLILPVFALYAEHLPGGENHTLVGLALGMYGLTQALLQLPFGMASDRVGRKRVIYFGLALFALGSFVAASADDIYMVIIGRTIQGAGAINAAVTALLADLTREEHRTKAMAMVGGTIGLTFALSLVLGPALYHLISIPGIFAMTGALALLAIPMMKFVVPDPPQSHFHSDAEATPAGLPEVLRNGELRRLNFGIFALHVVQMAMFVVVPLLLRETGGLDANHHWQVYLPVLAISVVFMAPLILYGEKKAKVKPVFVGSVALMLVTQLAFVSAINHFWGVVTVLTLYFVAFNVLEASLPSLVSKIAPARAKGTAMGVYNTSQALGLFVGGAAGGILSQHFGAAAVFEFGSVLIAIWLYLAYGMKAPPAVKNLMFHISALSTEDARRLEQKLKGVMGVAEASVMADEGVAYLKVDSRRFDEQALRHLLPSA